MSDSGTSSDFDRLSQLSERLKTLWDAGDHKAWAKLRRLQIVAPCCKSEPVIEVMNTDPPCVLVAQPDYSGARPDDPERKPWAGVRHGGRKFDGFTGIERLAINEQQAAAGGKQVKYVQCRHERWAVPLDIVVNRQGRYVLTKEDKPRRGVI